MTPLRILAHWLSRSTAALLLIGSPVRADDLILPDGKPPPAPPPDEKAEVFPKVEDIVSLRIDPSAIQIPNRTDYAQTLVTATLKDGTTADVTRLAKLEVTGGAAQVNALGIVNPKADGQGELIATAGTVTAKAPVAVAGADGAGAVPDYRRDVAPVISKAGCNAGTCHGAKEGKNGFKLSLRGYDPIHDIRSFTDDLAGRRVNVAFPDSSLMLLKPTGAVPHEGGQVMTENSKYYSLLRQWIAGGAKFDAASPRVTKIELFPANPVVQQLGAKQQMRVVATYADGKMRDVTSEAFIESGNGDVAKHDKKGLITTYRRGEAPVLARFEGNYAATTVTVMGDRSGFAWEEPPANNEIDKLIAAKLKRTKTAPSAICSDLEFIRRIYLDLTGLPPAPDDIRAFLADPRDSRWKRDSLIEKLMGSELYVDHMTNKWCDLLQVNSKFLAGEGAAAFRLWIRNEIAQNTPYDQFARKILTATGSTKENPAASYFKILRKPEETMENTTHLWLATRFNCNKCHDHPFERWTQDQYYQMGAFFAQTGLERDPASGDRKIGGTDVEAATPFYEFVIDRKEGEMKHLRTGKVAPPTFPYPAKTEAKEGATRREQLAAWITSPDNQYFAKSYANRIWGYLLGTGIIEPLDDIRAGNPPTNPELLDWLTKQFIDSGFDTRHLVRTICRSRAYQLSVQTNRWNADDTINYSHAQARRLPAEVLFDAIYAATGAKSRFPGLPVGTHACALPDPAIKTADGFLGNLGQPARESTCECERSHDLQLGPVMALVSGPTVNDAINAPDNAITKLVAEVKDDRALIDELFLRFLGRPAGDIEAKAAQASVSSMNTGDHELAAALAKYESELAPVTAQKEKDRLAEIATAKDDLAKYESEQAPKIAAAEKQRQEKIAAAQKGLADADAALPAKLAEWEKTKQGQTGWVALDPKELTSTLKKAKLEKQPDLSVFASGEEGKQIYTFVAETTLPALTGLRLEAMTDDRLGAKGPGRSGGGNFVLSEIEAFWTPAGSKDAAPQKIKFTDAIATFSQGGYDVKTAIDGQTPGEPNGWAIHPDGVGKPQTAVFVCSANGQPTALGPNGGTLRITLNHQYPDGKHTLGRFRLSVTSDPGQLNFGLSKDVTEILAVAPSARNDAQNKTLLAYFRGLDAGIKTAEAAVAEAQKPLPEDPKLNELKARLARSEQPLPIDPKLAQLRRDVELSHQQLATQRLIGAQDLAWALINNPAFLFNR